jgi:hypothetical protein
MFSLPRAIHASLITVTGKHQQLIKSSQIDFHTAKRF